jgi:hypothetical protein
MTTTNTITKTRRVFFFGVADPIAIVGIVVGVVGFTTGSEEGRGLLTGVAAGGVDIDPGTSVTG